MNYEWYSEMPAIFQAVIIALCIMIIMMAIISGIFFLPKKNREMKTELLGLDREIAKKKVMIHNQNKEYIDAVERSTKKEVELTKKIKDLEIKNGELETTKEKLEVTVESLKKKVGGRPKKTA